MNVSAPEFNLPPATSVELTAGELKVRLSGAQHLSVPLAWYP